MSFRPTVEKVDDTIVASLNDLMHDMMHIGTMQVAPGSFTLGHPTDVMTTSMVDQVKRDRRGLEHRLSKRNGKKNYRLPPSYDTDKKITPMFLTKIVPMSVRRKAIEESEFEADITKQTFGNTKNGPVMNLPPLEEMTPLLDTSRTVVGRLVRPKKKKKHYMMSKPWVTTASRSTPAGESQDKSKVPMRRKLQLETVLGYVYLFFLFLLL
jgi:hypothetical protein